MIRRWRLAVAALFVVSAGVATNFTPIKTPNDGVYYVAAARALVEYGTHVDATVVPYGPPITRQNGIVYVLAGIMTLAGRAWSVVYAVTVTALWTWALIAMTRLYNALTVRQAAGGVEASMPASGWVLAVLTFLHYDLLNDSTSFMNEGVYAPVFFAVAADVSRRLVGASTPADAAAALRAVPRTAVAGAVVFVLTGLFFRNQHVIVLPLAAAAFYLAGRRALAVAVPLVAVAAFGLYAAMLPAPVTDGYFATVTSAESIEASDLAYALALFTGPLSLTKVLPFDHPLTVSAALGMAGLVVAGLRRMRQDHPVLAAGLGLYLAGTLAFLVLLPFVSTRYYALANLPLIAALSMLLPSRERAGVWLALPVAIGLVVACAYAWSYFSGTKREEAYPQLVAHRRAAAIAGTALVFSSQPRLVWWVLGRPACAATPAACALASGGEAGRAAIFIGREDELAGQHGLLGYAVARRLTEPADGYATWQVERTR